MSRKIENIESVSQLIKFIEESKVVVGEWGGRCYRRNDDKSTSNYSIHDIILTLEIMPKCEETDLNICKTAIKKLDANWSESFEAELSKKNPLIWILGKIQQLFEKIFFNIDKSLNKITPMHSSESSNEEIKINLSNIEDMKKKAEEYAKRKSENSGLHHGDLEKKQYYNTILNAIKNVLDNKNFLKSPTQFIHDLKQARGHSEEWRFGEDDALEFFTKGLN